MHNRQLFRRDAFACAEWHDHDAGGTALHTSTMTTFDLTLAEALTVLQKKKNGQWMSRFSGEKQKRHKERIVEIVSIDVDIKSCLFLQNSSRIRKLMSVIKSNIVIQRISISSITTKKPDKKTKHSRKKEGKNEKRVPKRRAPKLVFFLREMLREIVTKLRPQRQGFEPRQKEKERNMKEKKETKKIKNQENAKKAKT